MKKAKSLPKIKLSSFKPVKYYEADITAPDNIMKIFIDLGRKVISDEQLLSVGVSYAITNAINGKLELASVSKKKKK